MNWLCFVVPGWFECCFFSNSISVLLYHHLPTLNKMTGTDADVIGFKCDGLTHGNIFASPSPYIFKYLLFLCYSWPWKWKWLKIKQTRLLSCVSSRSSFFWFLWRIQATKRWTVGKTLKKTDGERWLLAVAMEADDVIHSGMHKSGCHWRSSSKMVIFVLFMFRWAQNNITVNILTVTGWLVINGDWSGLRRGELVIMRLFID